MNRMMSYEPNVEANIEPCCKMLQDIGSSLKMVNYFVIATFFDVARCCTCLATSFTSHNPIQQCWVKLFQALGRAFTLSASLKLSFEFLSQVGAASSSVSTSSRDKPPVIRISKNTSNGYSHHPLRRNQLQGEDTGGGRPGSNNPWGKGSYSDLITMALASCVEKKMTLDEIYRWITLNIPYFRNKGDEISSSGWKVQNSQFDK